MDNEAIPYRVAFYHQSFRLLIPANPKSESDHTNIMGTNVHAFAHRLTALSMAFLASAGLIFCALSGLGCSFIEIKALKGQSIGNANGDVFEDADKAYLGVQCLSGSDDPFYDVEGGVDRLWHYTRIFFYVGLALGTLTTSYAWMLTSCVRPTPDRWRILSIFAALSALFQIPIFLVIESDNCNFDITRQTCVLSTGAYLNVASISIWIVMTVWVQCLRAPRWDEELDAWRVGGNGGCDSSIPSVIEKGAGEEATFDEPFEETGDHTVKSMETPPLTREQSTIVNAIRKNLSNVSRAQNTPNSDFHRVRSIQTKAYSEAVESSIVNAAAYVDKSVAVDSGNQIVNSSQNTDHTATSSTEIVKPKPGLHMSCVYTDGTKEDMHFPDLSSCCIGMGDATEGETETNFKTFTQDDLEMVGFGGHDVKNSNSDDFLVRKLRKEEKAAAARRAKQNMAPVASLEFVTNTNPVTSNRRKNRNGGHGNNVAINDDVSEMTRGSGWASGVSEILDDADLRHQPKALLEDLAHTY